MIKNITASVTFPISGEVLNVNFSPPPGVTAVVGPNGSGKTFTGSECARWLLFGKAALRGAAGDYATLSGKGEFTIAGADYVIERTPKKEEITDANGTVLAVGAKAVTAKVEEIFGYGLAIFDICNASVQKDADSFGKMVPAARKRMLDRVCGLSSNEAVEKQCREKARDYRSKAEALTSVLRAPEVPVLPNGYRSSEELNKERALARHAFNNAATLRELIKPVAPPPAPAIKRPEDSLISELEQHQQDYVVNIAERQRLQEIITSTIAYDSVGYTEEQLVAAEQRNIVAAEIERRGEKPTLPLETITSLANQWAAHYAAKNRSDEHVECPKCQHDFRVGGDIPSAPEITLETLEDERNAHARWALPQPAMPDGPDMTPAAIIHYRKAREDKVRHDRAAAMLDDVAILPDRKPELDSARAATALWTAYDIGVGYSKTQQEINDTAEAALKELGDVPTHADLDKLSDQIFAAMTYEKAKARADKDAETFAEATKEIAEANLMAEEYSKGAKALAEARTELKTVLTPLISAEASSLIFDMSNGKLKAVAVDEDMEITVDGRRIETLSGAGVTVANLALRIGLGQVLVKNTFPVFLGDEMDSEADAVRRESTLAAMRNLKGRLKQIILITHREIADVDMVVNLGE